MNPIREIERLAEAVASGSIGRREFLGRALAAGVGAATAGLLVEAWGGGSDARSKSRDGIDPDRANISDEIEDRLAICNWSDYVAEDTIPGFEEEYGVEVTY